MDLFPNPVCTVHGLHPKWHPIPYIVHYTTFYQSPNYGYNELYREKGAIWDTVFGTGHDIPSLKARQANIENINNPDWLVHFNGWHGMMRCPPQRRSGRLADLTPHCLRFHHRSQTVG